MITIRKGNDRGHANHGWLDSYHTFSFAGYHDPAHMGFRALRVINDDRIAAAEGFGTHPHRDMEILTYMLDGELAHKDSMGNGRVIRSGEVQGMSAGSGVTHSEFNASKFEEAHLLQVWIMPHTKNVAPSYGEWLPDGAEKDGWALTASEDGANGSIRIHQDAKLYVATPEAGKVLAMPIAKGRYGWLQIGKGEIELDGQRLEAGDGVAFSGGDITALTATKDSAMLLFDLA
jgi:redox-sensitive bicupin YhaK (pirin superfamily)